MHSYVLSCLDILISQWHNCDLIQQNLGRELLVEWSKRCSEMFIVRQDLVAD